MANEKYSSEGPSQEGAGPEEKGSSVKTKTVSSSKASGDSLRKRPAREIDPEDESKSTSAPPKMFKSGFSMTAKKPMAISIKLGANKPKEPPPAIPPKKSGLASVFNEDDDSEPEEMPPEAKMRMKNIGRETPTSAGPNSFNKGKQGFSDHQKLWERKLKSHTDQ
ncbi:PEST proteolytic signal-containing nuclear protein isoform b [Danio rerio]|uniref:PEST proteolytic signal-containing nuclear protein n=1 Tax=Danio rerio TaxID=7955 RepID=A0A2R8QL91_DANRE|nr:PEST proteolytic signal-containing nuclear protein isoform b [Danio rerio]|eukprot:NP_001313646.1 PEST proteolytic signal-containing nuclear protein isoform b [Danio rerio]